LETRLKIAFIFIYIHTCRSSDASVLWDQTLYLNLILHEVNKCLMLAYHCLKALDATIWWILSELLATIVLAVPFK